ncbi:transposase [Chloroflexota bacterium]
MGENVNETLKLQFDRRLRLEFHGAKITSDAGPLACRELNRVLRLMEMAPIYLQETRGGRNVQHELVPQLPQSVYSRLAGYEAINDALRLAGDPAMQVVVGRRVLERQAAGTNTLSRFETEVLVTKNNLRGLEQLNAEWEIPLYMLVDSY